MRLAAVELGQHERAGAGGQRGQHDGHFDQRGREPEHARREPPGQRRLSQQLDAAQQQRDTARAGAGFGRWTFFCEEQAKADQRTRTGSAAQQLQKGLRALRQCDVSGRQQHARNRRHDQRIARQRAQHFQPQLVRRAFGLQADFDQHDGKRKQHARDEDRGDRGRRQAGRAERDHAKRKADVAGVRIRRRNGVDARVSQMAAAEHTDGENRQKRAEATDRKCRDEGRLIELLPRGMRHGVEQQRRQCQPYNEAI
ncbi:hypothetical protein KCU90_g1276, partial [Aureobasidium melanogenum]